MKLPFMQFYPNDWLRDTRKLSAATKAVWIDIIALCWNEPERGVYRRTKRAMCHEHYLDESELDDVLHELKMVADVQDSPDEVVIMSRRIRRMETMREYERIKKRRQRCPGDVPANVPTDSQYVPVQTLEVRSQRSEKDVTSSSVPASGTSHAAKAKNKRPRQKPIEFWQPLVEHINVAWTQRKRAPYPWDDREFKKLRDLASAYQAWGVMAMWDLYMFKQTYYGKLTGYMLDGLKKDIGVIVDDPSWKSESMRYQEKLYGPSGNSPVDIKDITSKLVASVKEIPVKG